MKSAIITILVCWTCVAHADVIYPDAITFGPSYVLGPPAGFPWDTNPDYGDPLFIAGTVSSVGSPFAALLPSPPFELTLVVTSATFDSYGMWDDFTCNRFGMDQMFTGGAISIFLDSTPDADFTSPATFQDGELVLQAQMQSVHMTDDDPLGGCPTVNYPDVRMFFSFTSGSWYHLVVAGGKGMSGQSEAEIPGYYLDDIPAPLQALGYVLRIEGGIDIFGAVATQQTTWGKLKSLYR